MNNECRASNESYIQMITYIALSVSLILIFMMKILKFIVYKKHQNAKIDFLSRSNSANSI